MKEFNYWLNRCLEFVVMICVGLSVLVVLWGVLSRFVISVPSRWTEELATILLTWVAILGAAIAFRQKQHLGVDYLYNKLDPDAAKLNALIIHGLVILFAASVMCWGGTQLVYKTLSSGQITAALGIRAGYTYLAIPLSGLAIVLFSMEQCAENMYGRKQETEG